ncbi:hypothetical protein GCM10007937_60870 [Mesorhizobium albiziae]|nr:hypothetical protein GCM10007937_60870 [Mesorhizobium albiziae]
MKLADRRRDSDGEPQEAPYSHRRAKQPVEWFTLCIFEHQDGPAGIVHEIQRPNCTGTIELISKFVFVGETIEERSRRMVSGWFNDQHRPPLPVLVQAPITADNAFAVLPQELRGDTVVCGGLRVRHDWSDSAGFESAVAKLSRARAQPIQSLYH